MQLLYIHKGAAQLFLLFLLNGKSSLNKDCRCVLNSGLDHIRLINNTFYTEISEQQNS